MYKTIVLLLLLICSSCEEQISLEKHEVRLLKTPSYGMKMTMFDEQLQDTIILEYNKDLFKVTYRELVKAYEINSQPTFLFFYDSDSKTYY